MRRALTVSSALLLGVLAACCDDCDDDCDDCDSNDPVVFFEVERNDDPLTANYFGVLYPGDHFFIDGFIQDGGFDPLDGFAFTAGQPLHVDFQLFIDDLDDDLDVYLYDPQLDAIVGAWETEANPERGGVDVFTGNLDFHLAIASFRGSSNYSLEIDVQPLYAASAVEERKARPAGQQLIAGVDTASSPERLSAAPRAYRRELPAPALRIEREITLDERSGFVLERIRLVPVVKS